MADYISELNGQQMDAALKDMAMHDSEAWAKGTRNGVNVNSNDECYHNNSLYYASRANTYATNAAASAAIAQSAIQPGDAAAVLFDRAQSLTNAQKKQAKENIDAGGATNPNLLDNWWWGSASLINQRGVTSNTVVSNQYIIDRWYVYGSGSWAITSSGIQFTNPADSANACLMNQKFPTASFFDGKLLTASVLMGDGTTIYSGTITRTNGTLQHFYTDDYLYITFHSDDYFQIRTRIGTTQTIRAVKLEFGNVSTLANDSYPNKAVELEKCLYYFERVKAVTNNNSIAMGFGNGTSVYAPMTIHPKASTPTLTYSGTVNIGKNSGSTAATAISLYSINNDTGHCTLRVDASNTSGDPYRVIVNAGGYIDFNSDL